MSDFGLIRYDAMIHAIVECHRVDELKDLADKAKALDIYYKQAGNTLAERQACDVRLRAERRCGELLRELERASPVRNPAGSNQHVVRSASSTQTQTKSPYAQALDDTGMSRQRANRMEALAAVPAQEFEQALATPEKPSVSVILERVRTAPVIPPIDSVALRFWGRLRDFEREGLFNIDLDAVMVTMTDTMRDDVHRLVPLMHDLFNRLTEESHEFA